MPSAKEQIADHIPLVCSHRGPGSNYWAARP
jgi:hypothetical protein